MEETDLSNHNKKLDIEFRSCINSIEFESILKKYYRISFRKTYERIQFNLKNVKWCGIFELSLLSLWLIDLIKKEKSITFISPFPHTNRAFKFLLDYEFFNFLKENNIENDSLKIKKPYTPIISPMFPLAFQDRKEFSSLLKELSDPKRLELILKEIKDVEIVKSNAIHTIILKEISDNVFIHTKCKAANMIMTKLGNQDIKSFYPSGFEQSFFEKIGNREYIALVINDNGDGIYKTLLEAYERDSVLPPDKKKDNPTEIDIIKYAFLKHSTSRTDEERKAELFKNISSKSFKYPLPTGLYKVLNIVKGYNGLLYVRSGNSIVCYDFFSSENGQPSVNSDFKKFKNLAKFPGTQFRFYFPINASSTNYYSFESFSHFLPEPDRPIPLGYVSLNDYLHSTFDFENVDHISQLQKLLNKIESFYIKNEDMYGGLIFDACELNINSKNVIHYIVASLMISQNDKLSCILINIDAKKIRELQEDFGSEEYAELMPLVAFDTLFRRHLIGVSPQERNIYYGMLNKNRSNDKIDSSFIQRYKHLFDFSHKNITIKYSKNNVLKSFKENVISRITKTIMDPRNNIYYEDKKVLVSNRYYCLGFFEIHNIFESKNLIKEIMIWLSIQFQELKPDRIITLGKNCKEILDQLYLEYKIRNVNLNAKRLHISTPLVYSETFKISREISDDESVLIVTDVIGTAETLETVLKVLTNKKISNILTLIQTNNSIRNFIEVNLKKYDIDYIIFKGFTFYRTIPKTWDYSEICIVDKKNNRIIENEANPKGPLWIELESKDITDGDEILTIKRNKFLEEVVGTSNVFINGHFVSRNNHLTCIFNIPMLIDYYTKYISKQICKYIEDNLKKEIKKTHRVSHIIFPYFNPGLDKIASDIAKNMKEIELIPISIEDLETGIHQKYSFKDSAVIVMDDALVTGSTIDRLIDIVTMKKPSHIFLFVILKRGTDFQARRFENLKQSDETTIQARYLVDAEIPIFKGKDDCPVCQYLGTLDAIKSRISGDDKLKEFSGFIDTIITNLSARSVSTICQEEKFLKKATENFYNENPNVEKHYQLPTPFTYVNFRWQLELAKREPVMRKYLNNIVENYSINKKAVLLLIKVISDEKYYFLKKEKIRKDIFYDKFANKLTEACKYFLTDIKNISSENIIAILNILVEFEETYFVDHLSNLLINCKDDKDKIFSLLIFFFIPNIFRETPLKASKILEEATNNNFCSDINRLLLSLSDIFRETHNALQAKKKRMLYKYKELKVLLHNVNHKIDNINHYINSENIEKESIERSWGFLYAEIEKLNKTMAIFRDSLLSEDSFKRLREVSTKIEISLSEIQKIFRADIIDYDSVKDINIYVKRIQSLLVDRDNPEGLNIIIESFRIDIRGICFDVLNQENEELQKKGINYDYDFPDESCQVFGEEPYIISIFKNLIENVHIHSNGNELLIKAMINIDKEELVVLFLNNGDPIYSTKYKEGLESVSHSVNISGGTFSLNKFDETHTYYENHERFSTVAQVVLPLINKE